MSSSDYERYLNGRYIVYKYAKVGSFNYSGKEGLSLVLIVAGGGGGGSATGASDPGGGGAGGLVFLPYVYATKNAKIVVGNGGEAGKNGGDSMFSFFTAKGGGYGGCDSRNKSTCETGGDGGSGGGGGPNNGVGGNNIISSYCYVFGNKGGNGKAWGNGGAGGGAGSPGESSTESIVGKGGDGLSEVTINSKIYDFNIIFGNVGQIIDGKSYFAGGGSGGGESNGVGGKGGGGNSTVKSKGGDGMSGTGGGGSGGDNLPGGKGGSGIVLIAYSLDRNKQKTCKSRFSIGPLYFMLSFALSKRKI